MSLTHRPWSVRALQAAAVAAAYGAWLVSQYLLEKSRGAVTGFTDHSHELLAGANAYLNAHSALADVVLAVSSLEVDLAAICMVTFFFTRRESRPLLALWLILIMRQLCQASISTPAPDGMIWRYPGFPTIVVTYGTSTDFFFSGHMALATLLAAELTAQRAPRLKQAVAWGIAFAQALVILSMRFHYFTDVVAGCLAAVAATQLAEACGRWLDARFAPWSATADRLVATSGAVPLRARWPIRDAAAWRPSRRLERAGGGRP
jgi:PAP2 superfamily C-terminal